MTDAKTAYDSQRTYRTASLIDEVANWLIEQALGDSDIVQLFEGCCNRLLNAGVPLSRGHISFSILHPLYSGTGMTWTPQQGTFTENFPNTKDGKLPEEALRSPIFHLIRTRIPYLRRHLVGEEAILDFPILTELRDGGATDYLAFIVGFGQEEMDGMAGSWATERASGFSDSDLHALLRIQWRLGVACKIRVREQIALNVVNTYLGPLAGQRVLNGQIKRGDGETIRAVIWYSDMRGSTGMAERVPRDDFIQALNDYFECTAGAVRDHGGQILAFIGDAVMAIFPLDEGQGGAAQACRKAMDACREATARLETANAKRAAKGAEMLSYGLALHLGDVLFGNIGVPERVSFSVIGPTVNEVARLEALTKELGHTVLASGAFAENFDAAWTNLGAFPLRGVGTPIEVFTPAGD